MDLARLVEVAPSLSLSAPQLVLRRYTQADVAMAIEQENDRSIMRWIRDAQPADVVRARAESMASPWQGKDGEWLALTALLPDTSRAVGLVVCRVTLAASETMEIGYRLSADVHRRGLGFAACTCLCSFLFDVVRVRKLVAFCAADNEPSWRLMAKLGMQREAHFREYTQLAGAWRDEFVYGLLAREWRSATRSAVQ